MMQPGALCCSEPRSGEAGWHLLASSRHAGCNCLFALQSRTLLAFHRTLKTRSQHNTPSPFHLHIGSGLYWPSTTIGPAKPAYC